MGRLTEKDDNGNWRLKGLRWGAVRSGAVLTREASQKIYGALCKLLDYEETGMDPDEIERMMAGYLPSDRKVAVDRAHQELYCEVETCKKALMEQGEKFQAYKKDLDEQDGKQDRIPVREYPEGHAWGDRFMRRFTQKE